VANNSADVTSSGRSFRVCGPVTGKARLPTVDSLLVGTIRRLVPTERNDRRLGRSATRVKGPTYPGASLWTSLLCKERDLELDYLRDALRVTHAAAFGHRHRLRYASMWGGLIMKFIRHTGSTDSTDKQTDRQTIRQIQ